MTHDPWVPRSVAEIDLLSPGAPGEADVSGGPVLALVRAHTAVLGVVDVDLGPQGTLADHRAALSATFRDALAAHGARFGCDAGDVGPPAEVPPCLARRKVLLRDAPSLSVLVATHDRPELLRHCLESLLSQEHPPLEVVVVDNARSSDATERMVTSETYSSRGVRYVREDIAGLGRAHNTGVAHSAGDVVAITDDDVLADRYWTSALLQSFVEHDAGCVTGLILPVELRTREQSWVEQYGGFARGYDERTYSLLAAPPDDPLFPFAAGRFGSGANMAFSRDALGRAGGFDPALGAGTKARGGDDLAAFAQTLLAGDTLVYQPDAVVRHRHHAEYAALHRMAQGYGVGLGAYLTSIVTARPGLVAEIARRVPAGVRHFTSPGSVKNQNRLPDYPRDLVVTERLGLLRGPLSYATSRWDARRQDRSNRGATRSDPSPEVFSQS